MNYSHTFCYQAVVSKDARFDGLFYTAVKTTGIYCRPVCKVPAPKSENCEFYTTPAEAESHGYRPCLRCKPEMAPQYSDFAQNHTLLDLAVGMIDQEFEDSHLIDHISESLGVTSRHLRRLFSESLGVSPSQYILTKRLLAGKYLLGNSNLSIATIALQVGFGSASRFTEKFKHVYGLTPSQIRRDKKGIKPDKKEIIPDSNQRIMQVDRIQQSTKYQSIKLSLSYRPPYDWDQMIGFMGYRAVPMTEWVDQGIYYKLVRIKQKGKTYTGWISVEDDPQKDALKLSLSESLEPCLLTLVKHASRVFDCDANPLEMDSAIQKVRLPGCFDFFEMSVRAVLGQLISVKAATTLTGRFVEALGESIETPYKALTLLFPQPETLVGLDNIEETLGQLGITLAKTQTILAIAHFLVENPELRRMDPHEVKSHLLKLKGIGTWTGEYLTMRGLSYPDAFPVDDLGIKQKLMPLLTTPEGLPLTQVQDKMGKTAFNRLYETMALEFAKTYEPFRSYFTLAIWLGKLDEGEDR